MKAAMVAVSVALLAGCASMTAGPRASATADLRNAIGQPVGTARLEEVGSGVHMVLEMTGMPPGEHAVHVHAVGRCEPPAFASAGPHFNPGGRHHGLLNPEGPHAGDLPNITIGSDGRGRMETMNERVTLSAGANSLLDADGSALVVHAAADDFKTDPAGNAGARIACGVITETPMSKAEPVRGY